MVDRPMSMEQFESQRAYLVSELAAVDEQISGLQTEIAAKQTVVLQMQAEKSVIEARIAGMDAALSMLTAPAEVGGERKRQAVQPIVLAYLANEANLYHPPPTEGQIVTGTGLPAASVHEFLLRAVRKGTIIRDGHAFALPETPDVEPGPALAEAAQ
jgi:hypothetical protein